VRQESFDDDELNVPGKKKYWQLGHTTPNLAEALGVEVAVGN
jgi:hypothetical protein